MSKLEEYIRDGRAPIPTKKVTSRVMRGNKAKDTKPELKLRKALWEANLRGYRLHVKKIPGTPDIVYGGKKLAIFVNGCYWHRCPECNLPIPKSNSQFWTSKFEKNIVRDKRKIDTLNQLGWKTLVIWECQIRDTIDSVIEIIQQKLNE